MKPILANGIEGFLSEEDVVVAEGAVIANMKLIEGVVTTYPDDRELLLMAAMARANYAFAFVQDDLEALRLAHPDQSAKAQGLLNRALNAYKASRAYAERALADNGGWSDVVAGRSLDSLEPETFKKALAELEKDDAEALFWLAFAWGGSMQANLDPAQATQLPKIEMMIERVLQLDERVFYDVGGHLLAGVFMGFRAPALGGDPKKAIEHFNRAQELGGVLLPAVLKAQFVFAQTERPEDFKKTLNKVINSKTRADRALFEVLAKKKACRLLANFDQYFLDDAKPVPESCHTLPHKFRLREEPLEEEEEESAEETPTQTKEDVTS